MKQKNRDYDLNSIPQSSARILHFKFSTFLVLKTLTVRVQGAFSQFEI